MAQFGSSVSLRNNILAVGAITAPGATGQSGAAYVFAPNDGSWNQLSKLSADDGADSDNFGMSVSVFGQTVAIGATGHTPPTSGVFFAGAAYVFRQKDGVWRPVAELAGSDGITGGDFGTSVAVFDNTLLVGADQQHPPVEGYAGGEAYVYKIRL